MGRSWGDTGAGEAAARMQQCLYLRPLPQGQGSLRPGVTTLARRCKSRMGRNLFARVENSMKTARIRCVLPAEDKRLALPPWPNDPSSHFYNTNHRRDTEDTAKRVMERSRTLLARFCDVHAATASRPVGELYTLPGCRARARPSSSRAQRCCAPYNSLCLAPLAAFVSSPTEAKMPASGKRRMSENFTAIRAWSPAARPRRRRLAFKI
jgi:hypothetical protein